MSLPLLEPFTHAFATLLNPPWSQIYGAIPLAYNGPGQCYTNGGGAGAAFDNSNAYNNDQYAQLVINAGQGSARWAEVLVRASGANATAKFYRFKTNGLSGAGNTFLDIVWNNVSTTLRSFVTTFTTGDILKISITGTVITCYKNGVSLGTYDTAGDTNKIASGAAGIGIVSSSSAFLVDDWEGGNGVIPAQLTGTALGVVGETALVLGSKTIIFTLTGDTFLPWT